MAYHSDIKINEVHNSATIMDRIHTIEVCWASWIWTPMYFLNQICMIFTNISSNIFQPFLCSFPLHIFTHLMQMMSHRPMRFCSFFFFLCFFNWIHAINLSSNLKVIFLSTEICCQPLYLTFLFGYCTL